VLGAFLDHVQAGWAAAVGVQKRPSLLLREVLRTCSSASARIWGLPRQFRAEVFGREPIQ
jgi:hypothetical protein